MFLGFANFYWRFIQGFSRIATSLTLILKTLGGTEFKTKPGEGGVGVGCDSRAGRGKSEIGRSGIDNVEVGSGEVEIDEVGKKVQNLSKSKKTIRSSDFLTPGAKLIFTKLRQAFIKTPILHYYDLERYIQIETDVSGYAISGVLGQLTLNDLGQWHLVAFFSQKWFRLKPGIRLTTVSFYLLLKPSRLGSTI